MATHLREAPIFFRREGAIRGGDADSFFVSILDEGEKLYPRPDFARSVFALLFGLPPETLSQTRDYPLLLWRFILGVASQLALPPVPVKVSQVSLV